MHVHRWLPLGFAILLVPIAIPACTHTSAEGEATIVDNGEGRAVEPAYKLPPATQSQVRAAISNFDPEGIPPHFLAEFLQSKRISFRLIDAQGARPALSKLVSHAVRLIADGLPAGMLQPASVEQALSDYRLAATKLNLVESREGRTRLEATLKEKALLVELQGWRLAAQVFDVTVKSEQTRLGGWPGFRSALLNGPDELFRELLPPVPGYYGVIEALSRYRMFARSPQGPIDPTWPNLRPMDVGPGVVTLRKRLQEEGFTAHPTVSPSRWGEGLSDAIRKFQKLHSLDINGRVDGATFRELAVPLARRVEQLEAVEEHMRSTLARREPARLVVNIPAFTLQHLEGGRLLRSYKVIVGAVTRDSSGRITRAGQKNTTPRIAGRLDKMVLNPSWHVPQRIKEEELDVMAAKNPNLYDSFRLYVDDEGIERAVQLPGPNSALGKVKMSFPNADAIFLHDTPRTELFKERMRAFSHGCIRVEDAIGLATSLLDRDSRNLSSVRAKSLLQTNFETPVSLGEGLPLIIEYVTAGMGEDGAFHFFPDVYGLGYVQGSTWIN